MSIVRFVLFVSAAIAAAQTPQDDKRLLFSTYLGGNRTEDAAAVAVDSAGHTYVAGKTDSGDFSGKGFGSINLNFAVSKAFLTKYSPDGKQIVWSHIIGGSSNTRANAVAVDCQDNVYLAGTTGARDFPLLNAVQDKQTGLNIAFLMKFDATGKLLFSTYLGGTRNEEGLAVAVDSQNSIYLAGRASSSDFPVKNAFQPTQAGGGQDAFVAKFTSDYQLAWASYIGGTAGTDNIYAIAVGPDDSLFVTGESMSPGLATEGAWIRQPISYSSFVAKLSPEGTGVQWLSYVGHRSGYTKSEAITVDAQGRVWLGGTTNAKTWPMSENAIQPQYAGGHRDGFVVRLSADGSTAEYATYLGGKTTGSADPDDTVSGLKVDGRGHLYVTGETVSADFLTSRPVQPNAAGATESYLIKLDADNKQILFSTFWGGSKRDATTALALGPDESVTLVGETSSDNLPLQNAFRKQMAASTDAFVTRLCDPWPAASVTGLQFVYTRGSATLPDPQMIEVTTGCPAAFDVEEITADQPWLRLRPDGQKTNLKLTVELTSGDLPAGEYKAELRLKVPAAFYPEVKVPVTLTVVEPPVE
ncbi:MAG: SBBP repeat-containing protein [Bryobacterales bacterium]|nr:SBBP repeat-containing protein [Bryobacterales bacterium]